MATDTIPTPSTTAKGFEPEPLDYVCEMEDPLQRVYNLLTGLMHIQHGDLGSAISTIAEVARDECQKLQGMRDKLFHDLHPLTQKEAAQ
ncbi:hypothetical protein [Qipengyuania huizhouensis]|uniref:hypothetical protein n=1 Tax=Qipengyuania huizhouensis TaxID=2867245 RepID=UPI001C871186|nr:hypothetical protein [Qipengyuania huizhouensis]MBX7460805.1 hypothetical protein [Qipengyuania huizhouensis]